MAAESFVWRCKTATVAVVFPAFAICLTCRPKSGQDALHPQLRLAPVRLSQSHSSGRPCRR